jgi:hypothetical protein
MTRADLVDVAGLALVVLLGYAALRVAVLLACYLSTEGAC